METQEVDTTRSIFPHTTISSCLLEPRGLLIEYFIDHFVIAQPDEPETMSSPKSVRIEPDWDLILHITQIKSDTTDELDPSIEPTEFQVKKKLLAGEENSPMLAAMFRGPWHERSASTVYLKDISIAALEIWLMAIHGRFPTIDHVSIETIWLLLCSANKYGFHVKLLCSFFEDWFLANSLDYAHHGDKEQFYRQVLYPACIFDFAKGFQIATLYLTYNSTGHITEMQPGRVTELGDRNKIRPQLHLWNSAIRRCLTLHL